MEDDKCAVMCLNWKILNAEAVSISCTLGQSIQLYIDIMSTSNERYNFNVTATLLMALLANCLGTPTPGYRSKCERQSTCVRQWFLTFSYEWILEHNNCMVQIELSMQLHCVGYWMEKLIAAADHDRQLITGANYWFSNSPVYCDHNQGPLLQGVSAPQLMVRGIASVSGFYILIGLAHRGILHSLAAPVCN